MVLVLISLLQQKLGGFKNESIILRVEVYYSLNGFLNCLNQTNFSSPNVWERLGKPLSEKIKLVFGT